MATLVNDGLSPALYAAVKRTREEYTRTGYLSTTSCIDSPRIRVLTQRHDNEIVIPASRLLPSLIGTAVHREIERMPTTFEIDGIAQEKEFVIEIGGIKFSGRPDWYSLHDEEVGDEKTTSVWTYTFNPEGKSEHLRQVDINGYLIRRYGFPCKRAWIELIFLDWKRSSATRDQKYPKPSEIIRVDALTPDAEVKRFIEERVALHLAADAMKDNELPPCTAEEQWKKPSGFAVHRVGLKKAVRVFETEEEAQVLAKEIGRTASIEERTGERTRCEWYCDVQQFCNQYREERASV